VEFLFQFRAMEKELLPAIENRIYTIRGQQVMLDSDLSTIFNVQVKRINEQVARNLSRFPTDFAFQLTSDEWHQLKSQIATSTNTKGGKVKVPRVFTEHGIAMLATFLRSDLAIQMSVFIIKVFVQSRANSAVLQSIDNRLVRLEKESALAHAEIDAVWRAIRVRDLPEFGIFFNNQLFDAYAFFNDIIMAAKSAIILIDNYIDHTVLLQLAKRKEGVTAVIYTAGISASLRLDLEKHNAQYPTIEIRRIQQVHDRFLLIDGKELYHIGASIKDLGKKWFAFSRMDSLTTSVLEKLPL
jgi:hypothetical protein